MIHISAHMGMGKMPRWWDQWAAYF